MVYLNALHNPFVYDDHRTIVDNGSIRTLTDMRSIVLHDVTRPLVNLSYAMDQALWGPGPFGFHLTSVLLHVLNVILLFLIAWRLAEDRDGEQPTASTMERKPQMVAFVAAALFAVHPMMTEAVGYVSGRSEVLCGTFFLLAFLAARRWMRGGGARWWLLALGLWGVALLAKEIAAMLPVVLFAYDRLVLGARDGQASKMRRLLRLHVPFISLAAAGGAIRLGVFVLLEHPGGMTVEWRSLLDEAAVVWRYVGLLLIPRGQAIYHQVQPIATVWDLRTLVAALAIVAAVAVAWRVRKVDSLASLGVIWFFVLLVPSSLIVVLDQGEGMAEHRVYLASCGMFLAAGSLIGLLMERMALISPRIRGLAYAAVAVGILVLGAHTVLRNAVWADTVGLWREAADMAPNDWLPRTVLGETLHEVGRHDEAVVAYRTALQLRPNEPFGYLKLGLCLAETGRTDEAVATLEQLRSRDPRSTVASTGLGAIAMVAGQPEQARSYFVQSLETDPRDVMARQWLAVLEEEAAANPAEALRRCEEIQQLEPGKLSNEDCIRRNRARLAAGDASARAPR